MTYDGWMKAHGRSCDDWMKGAWLRWLRDVREGSAARWLLCTCVGGEAREIVCVLSPLPAPA